MTELPDSNAGGTSAQPIDSWVFLVSSDLTGLYSVNVAAAEERLTVLRLWMTLIAAPFVASVALVSAKVITPKNLLNFHTTPKYIFGLLLVFGILGFIPFMRFIEVNSTHMRTARAINNYRMLAYGHYRGFFENQDWKPNLPLDAAYPKTFSVGGWGSINVYAIALGNSVFIGFGVVGASGEFSSVVTGVLVVLLLMIVHVGYFYFRVGTKRKSAQPTDVANIGDVEV